jgi:hypothetical protein
MELRPHKMVICENNSLIMGNLNGMIAASTFFIRWHFRFFLVFESIDCTQITVNYTLCGYGLFILRVLVSIFRSHQKLHDLQSSMPLWKRVIPKLDDIGNEAFHGFKCRLKRKQ